MTKKSSTDFLFCVQPEFAKNDCFKHGTCFVLIVCCDKMFENVKMLGENPRNYILKKAQAEKNVRVNRFRNCTAVGMQHGCLFGCRMHV